MVDVDVAVCWPPGIDYLSLNYLLRKGIRIIEVPEEEMRNAACNTLALRPGKVVLVAGNPRTAEALGKAGIEVVELEWSEYTRQGGGASGGGGPICSTAPLIRDPQPE
jgi:N-dimethylarginine dimethylaminohydrolase